MRMEKFNSALDHIDYDLVDEFIRERESIERKREVRKQIIKLAPIAACFVICISIGAAILGFNLGFNKNASGGNSNPNEQMQIFFAKEGKFVFEYQGKVYQAYVTPAIGYDYLEDSVSIQNVGQHITNVTVVDERGNEATMEIYSSKNGADNESVWETNLYKGMEPTTFTVEFGECDRLMFWLNCSLEDNGSHTYAIYDITLNK